VSTIHKASSIIPIIVKMELTDTLLIGLYIAFCREALELNTNPKKNKLYSTYLKGQSGKPQVLCYGYAAC
jgi:hypothetical protein